MISRKILGVALAAAMMQPQMMAIPAMVTPQIDMTPNKYGNKDRNTTAGNRVSQKKRRQRARRK